MCDCGWARAQCRLWLGPEWRNNNVETEFGVFGMMFMKLYPLPMDLNSIRKKVAIKWDHIGARFALIHIAGSDLLLLCIASMYGISTYDNSSDHCGKISRHKRMGGLPFVLGACERIHVGRIDAKMSTGCACRCLCCRCLVYVDVFILLQQNILFHHIQHTTWWMVCCCRVE